MAVVHLQSRKSVAPGIGQTIHRMSRPQDFRHSFGRNYGGHGGDATITLPKNTKLQWRAIINIYVVDEFAGFSPSGLSIVDLSWAWSYIYG